MTDTEDQQLQEEQTDDEQPDLSTAPEQYRDDQGGWFVRLVAFSANNSYPILAVGGLLTALLSIAVELPRSVQLGSTTFVVSLALIGRPTGQRALDVFGGPELVWIVDVDLLDGDGAGVFSCPRPTWSEEWEVTEHSLWWATPNLGFGRGLDMEEKTIEGTWRGSLPDPVLMRALSYIRYNRESYRARAKRGEAIEMNKTAILRNAAMSIVEDVVGTFEQSALPDDGVAFDQEVEAAIEDYGIESEGSELFDEDPADLDSSDVFDFDRSGGGSDE